MVLSEVLSKGSEIRLIFFVLVFFIKSGTRNLVVFLAPELSWWHVDASPNEGPGDRRIEV